MDTAIQETMDIDLSQYKWQGDWGWFLEAESHDSKRIDAQIGYLSDCLYNMKKGDRLSVIDICKNPKYYEVCVKVLCVLIVEWRYQVGECRDYVFNMQYNEVRRTY